LLQHQESEQDPYTLEYLRIERDRWQLETLLVNIGIKCGQLHTLGSMLLGWNCCL